MTVPDFPERPGGRWVTDDVYEFDAPVETRPGEVAVRVDFSLAELPEELTKEMLIEAMTDPQRAAAQPFPRKVEVLLQCSGCGTRVTSTLDLHETMRISGRDLDSAEDWASLFTHIQRMQKASGGAITEWVCGECVDGE